MIICGVDLKASEARLALVKSEADVFVHIDCKTKKLVLTDERDSAALETLRLAIKSFAEKNSVTAFVIKTRNKKGSMAGGAVSFKIETLFQLSEIPIVFLSPQALAKFAKGNMGGAPGTVLAYQLDAFRCAALHIASTR